MSKDDIDEGRHTWSIERYSQQLAIVTEEIASITKEMNKIDGQINGLRHLKTQLQMKHSKKVKYQNLLIKNIDELMKDLFP